MIINGIEYQDRTREEIESEIRSFIIKQITNALQEELSNGNITVVPVDDRPQLQPYISLQYYYSERTNKVLIEWDISDSVRFYAPREIIKDRINGHIMANMQYDIRVIPEILLMEDKTHEMVDSSFNLSPYTIGYWKCLTGKNELIEDRTEVMLDLEQYHKGLDEKPEKNFDEFIEIVKEINKRYKNEYMTDEEKSEYIQGAYEIWDLYKDDLDTYNTKMQEYNHEFSESHGRHDFINEDEKIVEMYAEYKEAYNDFFNRELPDIIPHVILKRYIVKGLTEKDELENKD